MNSMKDVVYLVIILALLVVGVTSSIKHNIILEECQATLDALTGSWIK